jgi:Helicase conserved C-terminal domain
MEPPMLVAEALLEVRDLLAEALRPGERRPAEAVAAKIAELALPARASDPPPDWLLPGQIRSYQRALAAIRRFGGALLADPVGSGKSYVSLAVARRVAEAPATIVAPAILLDHWRGVAGRLGVPVLVTSHERVSRGEPPPGAGPVIVDESHRFRNPSARRYRTLAPSLIGRPTLLVSATPVVNRMDDLAHQLLLAVPDDALRILGVPSLRRVLGRGDGPPALANLLVTDRRTRGGLPDRRELVIEGWERDDDDLARAGRLVSRLRLSRDPGVASLLKTGLLRALASSPAALLGVTRRYALLLHHARAAHTAGRHFGRHELRREAGLLPEQMVMWELLDDPGAPAELALGDAGGLDRLERHLRVWIERGDRKTALLRDLVADRRPTLVFTGWTETVHHLRRALGLSGAAWITGDRAGVGGCRYPRRAVLGAFDPRGSSSGIFREPPWLLVSTDVAAEGLNLQRVGRVVHYDLPWTSVRLEQRDGRALRHGSVHPDVSVVRFGPPPAVEAHLAMARRLVRKAALPSRIGVGRQVSGIWRWHQALEERWDDVASAAGWAAGRGETGRAVAAFAIDDGSGAPAGLVLVRQPDGRWREDPAALAVALEGARAPEGPTDQAPPPDPENGLLAAIRQWLRAANGWHWLPTDPDPGLAAALRVARERSALARRERRPAEANEADRVLAFLARGHTAGERLLAAGIAWGDPIAWRRAAVLGEHVMAARRPLSLALVALLVTAPGPGAPVSPPLSLST